MNDHERRLADSLFDLKAHSESVIALLELFAEHVPAGLPAADDGELVRIGAFVDSAVNALREACKTNTIAAYHNARGKVGPLLNEISGALDGASEETATLMYGLVYATQAFMDDHWLLGPLRGEPSAPAHDTQAAGASDAADDDVLEVIGDMITDLGPIETMAGMLVDQATSEIDEEQLRASAVAVHIMVKSLCGDLISDHEQRQKARAAL